MSEAPSYPLHPRSNKTSERLGRRIDTVMNNPESMPVRRRKTEIVQTPQETPLSSLDLLERKLLSLEGDKVQREKLRKDIADAEALLEQLKHEHEPNIVAVYDKELRINERLGIARHLADVYDQIATWGEAGRLEAKLDQLSGYDDASYPHPDDPAEEAEARYRDDLIFKKEYAEARKKYGQLDGGREDEAALETEGLKADDLTLPYHKRIAFAEEKISKRFFKLKGRAPTKDEVHQLIYGTKHTEPSPLSFRERAGQLMRRVGEKTLGAIFDRFADTSITQAVIDYKKLEHEYEAAEKNYKDLEGRKLAREARQERIQEEAKRINPLKQYAALEAVQARAALETPPLKETVTKGREALKQEKKLERKRRLIAREQLSDSDLKTERELLDTHKDDPSALEEARAHQKAPFIRQAEQEEGDQAAAQTLKDAVFNQRVEARLAQWRKTRPSAPNAPTKSEARRQKEELDEATKEARDKIIDELISEDRKKRLPEPPKDASPEEKARYIQMLEDEFMGLDASSIKYPARFSKRALDRAKIATMAHLAMEPNDTETAHASAAPALVIDHASTRTKAPLSRDWRSISRADIDAKPVDAAPDNKPPLPPVKGADRYSPPSITPNELNEAFAALAAADKKLPATPPVEPEAPELSFDTEQDIDDPLPGDELETVEGEAASLLINLLKKTKAIPVHTSASERAQFIKNELDRIPLTERDWSAPERQKALDQIRKARDISFARLQEGNLRKENTDTLAHQFAILNNILELTSRSTKKQEEYIRALESRAGELAIISTPEQKQQKQLKETAQLIEKVLTKEITTILEDIPEHLSSVSTSSELYLHAYKALQSAPSLKAMYDLQKELAAQSSEEASVVETSIRDAFYFAYKTIKTDISRRERLAGRDKEARERLPVIRKLPDVLEQLILRDPAAQRDYIKELVQRECDTLSDELNAVEKRFRTLVEPQDGLERRRMGDRSADIQLTLGAIQGAAEEAGIELMVAPHSQQDQHPVEQTAQRAA